VTSDSTIEERELRDYLKRRLKLCMKRLEKFGVKYQDIGISINKLLEILISAISMSNYWNIPGHEIEHWFRVAELATIIAIREGGDVRKTFIAGLLHDTARALEEKKGIDHASLSAKIAEEVLRRMNFDETFIRDVTEIISEHRFSSNKKPSSLESAILQDADKLDALGLIGVARVFAYGGFKRREIYDIFSLHENGSLAHFFRKIMKLPQLMHTKIATKLAQKRLKRIKWFIEIMLKEIRLEDIDL